MPMKPHMAVNIASVGREIIDMEKKIENLGRTFAKMVENANAGEFWRNITLSRLAFEEMQELPDAVPGEFENPAEKGSILSKMLDQIDEFMTPRLCIDIRNEIARLNPSDEDNEAQLAKLQDYINLDIPMEDFCKRHNIHLLFDPIERTETFEKVVMDVELECARRLEDHPRGMGFCFAYWSERKDVLASHGIQWRSPAVMNPRVIFD